MQPSSNSTVFPFSGLIIVIGALPFTSPLSLIGALTPNVLASVALTSTWFNPLTGPKIEAANSPLGPLIINFVVEAN